MQSQCYAGLTPTTVDLEIQAICKFSSIVLNAENYTQETISALTNWSATRVLLVHVMQNKQRENLSDENLCK